MTDPNPSVLTVDVANTNGDIVLALAGDIDMSTITSVTSAGTRALGDARPASLTIDMAGVAFCDSAGINGMVKLRNECHAVECAFGMTNLQPHVRRVLVDLTGLGEFLNIAA